MPTKKIKELIVIHQLTEIKNLPNFEHMMYDCIVVKEMDLQTAVFYINNLQK